MEDDDIWYACNSWLVSLRHARNMEKRNAAGGREAASWEIKWLPPACGWLKLNSDGAVKEVNGYAYAGRVLRDYRGEWVTGYNRNVGRTKVEEADLAWSMVR
ncbi:hypothetical protein PVK06_020166 [Gossypium arboreum]|uniref:RNase H type-1 domain-containing protein n=1 Tax=Gossypium arboreum TaxID=29729 RepID=A0ABR0PLR1_GOSAR|nr:hypothetical protein PVK06_020166 [Gossypium arboreum]